MNNSLRSSARQRRTAGIGIIRKVIDSGLVRSHEERRWLFEEPSLSRISPSILYYTKEKLSSKTLIDQMSCEPVRSSSRMFIGKWTANMIVVPTVSPAVGRRVHCPEDFVGVLRSTVGNTAGIINPFSVYYPLNI